MIKSGEREIAATVVLGVEMAASNVVPPSVDKRNQPARYPPAVGVNAPPAVK